MTRLLLALLALLAVVTLRPPAPRPAAQAAQSDPRRAALVAYALSLQGIPYVRGGRSASGGDCSGTMQHVYKTVIGIDIGATTFSQFPALEPIELSAAQDGDLWFGQFPDDQHVGMLWRQPDGGWSLIHNGADRGEMHVTQNFLSTYLGEHTMGYRRAL